MSEPIPPPTFTINLSPRSDPEIGPDRAKYNGQIQELGEVAYCADNDVQSRYECENDEDEIQRPHLVDRSQSGFIVQGDLINVIHGRLDPGGHLATLIVAEFRFICSDSSQRFRKAQIQLLFAKGIDRNPNGFNDPVVSKIAPYGKLSLNEATAECTVSNSIGVGLGNAITPNMSVNASTKMSKVFNKVYKASVQGIMRIEGRNFGPKNCAEWFLLENKILGDGVPTTLRSAILLRRQTNDQFIATIQITAKAGVRYSIRSGWQRLRGTMPRDDPLLFDPVSMPMRVIPEDMDVESLGAYDLKKLLLVD